jgi:hypothetical protein
MTSTKIALYRASVLADNVGVRLCLAAVLVMPSALVFLLPALALLGSPGDSLLVFAPISGSGGSWALLSLALGVGFAGAWLRIVCGGRSLVRRPAMRMFVVGALAVGSAALAIDLAVQLASPTPDDAGWLLFAALLVSVFLLAGTLGQPRMDRLHRA